ncbi:MAG: T9SS type A sorting domain-containing protein, partial [Bacteroidales bacterium]
ELTIIGNFSLSQCHVESVCGYLSTPNAVTDIYLNADGCKSENEILDLCVSGEEEIYDCNNSFYFYPNPAADIIYFENFHSNCVLKFYDQSGQLLRTETLPHSELDISPFDPGLYYFEILSAKEIIRRKLIIK